MALVVCGVCQTCGRYEEAFTPSYEDGMKTLQSVHAGSGHRFNGGIKIDPYHPKPPTPADSQRLPKAA